MFYVHWGVNNEEPVCNQKGAPFETAGKWESTYTSDESRSKKSERMRAFMREQG